MKKLLFAQYIDFKSDNRIELLILNLLHELRVVTAKQLLALIQLEVECQRGNLSKKLNRLSKQELIEWKRIGKQKYYYLSKLGHLSIGGVYSFPKMPEYNLNHYLQINNYLIKTLRILGQHRHLKKVVSERRQVFETKDFTANSKGRKYFVADYQVVFNTERVAREIVWNFEIELTMKTKRRYINGVFPKYIKELKSKRDNRLIYVTPSESIKEELELIKRYMISQEKETVDWPSRLHLLSAEEFEKTLERLVKNDEGINWPDEIELFE